MKIPEEALPATGWPGFVVVGPRRIARSIEDRAVARKASSRTVKVVRVGRDEALVLPGGTPTWWIDRPWGGFLVRAHVEETITDYERGWKHVEAALGAVIRWRKIGNWLVADPMAFLVVMTSPGTNWSRRVPPIPAGRYHLELGKTAIRAIEYDVIRFTREGESALAETARAEAAPLPSVPKPMDATIRGDKPSTKRQSHGCYESLDVALRAGAYAVDHCERDGEYLLANKRSTYAFEAFRLRRSR